MMEFKPGWIYTDYSDGKILIIEKTSWKIYGIYLESALYNFGDLQEFHEDGVQANKNDSEKAYYDLMVSSGYKWEPEKQRITQINNLIKKLEAERKALEK